MATDSVIWREWFSGPAAPAIDHALRPARAGSVACLVLGVIIASAQARAEGWADGFEEPTALSARWEARGTRVEQAGGFGGSAAVTAAAGDRRGTMWRRSAAGQSVELTARMRVTSTDEGGAVVGFYPLVPPAEAGNPLTSAYPPTPDLTGNFVALRVVRARDEKDAEHAQLHLTYAHPYCGQSLPFRHPSGRLAPDTWYDLRMRVWPSDGMYLARAWQRRSGTAAWTVAADLWPGKRHVVAYEGFEPTCVAMTVSKGAFVDDVTVAASAAPQPPMRLPPAEPINGHRFTILSYSWSSPDTKYLHDNVVRMEKNPFDGVAVQVGYPRLDKGSVASNNDRDNLGWRVFSKHRLHDPRYTRDLTAPAIRDLTTTPFARYRSNYAVLVSYMTEPPTMDWFDDAWCANVAANAGLIATVAKEGGCEGILFDPEEYGCAFWSWPKLSEDPLYQHRTYAEVRAKVRQRGAEFVRAINAAYPAVRILSLHAWDTAMRYDCSRRVTQQLLPEVGYGLLPAFLDGMLEGSDDRTVIIDGVETSYWVDALPDFIDKANAVREECIELSAVPHLFRRKVRVGFALYLDRDHHSGRPWYSTDLAKNHWTPQRLASVVGNALAAGDGFVWIYSETATWLRDSEEAQIDTDIPQPAGVKFVPDSYRQALDDGRRRAEVLRAKFGPAPERQ